MGWFDDSDSEGEESKNNRRLPLEFFDVSDPTLTSTSTTTSTGAGTTSVKCNSGPALDNACEDEKEDENGAAEVDPLDAYMNGVQATVMKEADNRRSSDTNTNTNTKPTADEYPCGNIDVSNPNNTNNNRHHDRRAAIKTEKLKMRLDVENEEEATAHWTTNTNTHTAATFSDKTEGDRFERRSPTQPSSRPSSYDSICASVDMASTFHRAGAHNPTKRSNDDHRHDIDDHHDDDHGRAERLPKRTIDPLAAVDHATRRYAPFRREFWEECGDGDKDHIARNWRTKHTVTCSVGVRPVLSFDEYGEEAAQRRRRRRGSSHDKATGGDGGEEEEEEGGAFAPEVLAYLGKNGYREPTPVQAQAIPIAMTGRDLLVTSQTGSGKTLAYLLPLITHVLAQPHIQPPTDGPIALILAPTRELAKQVHTTAKKLLCTVGGTSVVVTGGTGTYLTARELKKGCEVVVSTPGRFIDMVGGGNGGEITGGRRAKAATNCERITLVVLDEADKMLEMGFERQVGSILQNVRPDRQSWMFSATFGRKIERVAKGWLVDPVRIAIGRTGTSSEHVTQHVLVLPSRDAKKQWLIEMFPILAGLGRLIVFVASRAGCEEIADLLRNNNGNGGVGKGGLRVDSIHGDRHQSDRNAALASLRKGRLDALVATDVAARGLDITDVMTVCNFDCAKNLDSHVHRVGRAGRLSNRDSGGGGGGGDDRSREGGQEGGDGGQRTQEHRKGAAYTLLTPQNSDFAGVLVDAFRREGREVDDGLLQLSKKGRHSANNGGSGGGGGRNRWNRSGLGFRSEDGTGVTPQRGAYIATPQSSSGFVAAAAAAATGHGEEGTTQRTAKRSRWGER